jgi:hypothetical protein
VNWSATPTALVPLGVITVTSTGPAVPAGEVAVTDMSLLKMNDAAGMEPKSTAVAPVKPVPVISTVSPPIVVPVLGDTMVTAGIVEAVEELPLRKYHPSPKITRIIMIIQTTVDVFIRII